MKSTCKILMLFVLLAGVFCARSAYPCTAFALREGRAVYVGKNFDFDCDLPLIVVNKRNLRKEAIITEEGARATVWTSKYGSLTFNTGVGFATGGDERSGAGGSTASAASGAGTASDGRKAGCR